MAVIFIWFYIFVVNFLKSIKCAGVFSLELFAIKTLLLIKRCTAIIIMFIFGDIWEERFWAPNFCRAVNHSHYPSHSCTQKLCYADEKCT